MEIQLLVLFQYLQISAKAHNIISPLRLYKVLFVWWVHKCYVLEQIQLNCTHTTIPSKHDTKYLQFLQDQQFWFSTTQFNKCIFIIFFHLTPQLFSKYISVNYRFYLSLLKTINKKESCWKLKIKAHKKWITLIDGEACKPVAIHWTLLYLINNSSSSRPVSQSGTMSREPWTGAHNKWACLLAQ